MNKTPNSNKDHFHTNSCADSLNARRNTASRITVLACGILGFVIMLTLLISNDLTAFDDPIRHCFYVMRNPALNSVISAFTHLGDPISVVIICALLLVIKPIRISFGIPIAAGSVFASVLNKIIKHIVQRPRPDDVIHLVSESGFSFPSGHSISSMFLYATLIWLIRRYVQNRALKNTLTAILLLPLFGIGLSRIYCGVHFPSDVLAAWFLGIAISMATIEIVTRVQKR